MSMSMFLVFAVLWQAQLLGALRRQRRLHRAHSTHSMQHQNGNQSSTCTVIHLKLIIYNLGI